MKRKLIALMVLGGLALAGPQDNSLIIGAAQEPRVLAGDVVNAISNQSIKFEIENFLFAPIVQTTRDLNMIPVVVTEVPTQQNGRLRFTNVRPGVRRLELDYTIRPDAVWSDGRPISTEDVACTLKWARPGACPLPMSTSSTGLPCGYGMPATLR